MCKGAATTYLLVMKKWDVSIALLRGMKAQLTPLLKLVKLVKMLSRMYGTTHMQTAQ